MTWRILPLSGKYYGTIIENSISYERIEIWNNTPNSIDEVSERQYEEYGGDFEGNFDHTESKRDFELAVVIMDILNKLDK